MITCAEIARRWLAAGSLTATGAELARKLTAPAGVLDSVRPENIDRIETNLQIAHALGEEVYILAKIGDVDRSCA